MGKRNKNMRKTVIITTVGSLLGTSCSGYLEPASLQLEIEDHTTSRVVSISDTLTDDECEFLNAIIRLIDDIISDKFISDNLLLDSKDVLIKYGYYGNIIIDDNLLKILIAFSDANIRKAIENRDIVEFISLVNNLGLIGDGQSNIDLSNINEELLKKLNDLKSFDFGATYQQAVNNWFFEIGIVAFAVALVAVEIAVYTGIMVAGEMQYSESNNKSVSNSDLILGKMIQSKSVNVWDAYIQKNGVSDFYIFAENEINEISDLVIKIIDDVNPDYWNSNTKEAVRNSIAVFYINYLFNKSNERGV